MDPRKAFVGALILGGAALFPNVAAAQHLDLETDPVWVLEEGPGGPHVSVALKTRISTIDGDIESGIPLEFGDLFGTGYGFALEGSVLWDLEKVRLGPYLSLGWESYSGESFTDSFGDTLEADTLEMVTVLAGLKVEQSFESGLYWGGHLGMGLAHSSAVDGDFTFMGTPMDVEIFEATPVFAVDLGIHGGYTFDSFYAELGVGVRFQGAPKSDDFSFDIMEPAIPYFEIGIGYRF